MLTVYDTTNNRLRDTNAEERRQSLTDTVNRFTGQVYGSSAKYILHFVTKKFVDYFSNHFLDQELYFFQQALKKGNSTKALECIQEFMIRKKFHKNSLTNR